MELDILRIYVMYADCMAECECVCACVHFASRIFAVPRLSRACVGETHSAALYQRGHTDSIQNSADAHVQMIGMYDCVIDVIMHTLDDSLCNRMSNGLNEQ